MRWLDRLRGRPAAHDPEPERHLSEAGMEEALSAARAGDYATALAIWEPLAQAGIPRAQNNIGACFAEGLGVPADRGLAKRWLHLAAEAGDPVGERNYAALHMQDVEDAPADYGVAADYYRRAAEKGDAESQDMLSWMLLEGEVMPPDAAEAYRFAEQAANAGIASSMTRLGMLYHNAQGVERDAEKAVHWWRQGAAKGDADAQAMLGAAYHLGSGAAEDRVLALAWLIRATNGRSELARPFMGPVRESLTAEQVAEAERRAALPLNGGDAP